MCKIRKTNGPHLLVNLFPLWKQCELECFRTTKVSHSFVPNEKNLSYEYFCASAMFFISNSPRRLWNFWHHKKKQTKIINFLQNNTSLTLNTAPWERQIRTKQPNISQMLNLNELMPFSKIFKYNPDRNHWIIWVSFILSYTNFWVAHMWFIFQTNELKIQIACFLSANCIGIYPAHGKVYWQQTVHQASIFPIREKQKYNADSWECHCYRM